MGNLNFEGMPLLRQAADILLSLLYTYLLNIACPFLTVPAWTSQYCLLQGKPQMLLYGISGQGEETIFLSLPDVCICFKEDKAEACVQASFQIV